MNDAKLLTPVDFVNQEHRFLEEFKRHWLEKHGEAESPLTIDQCVDFYHEFLAALDSGELRIAPMSGRLAEWLNFAFQVGAHVESYTVPQYGDLPDDPLSSFSEDDIITQLKRYINRASTNARGFEESQRDMLKVAHYAGVLHTVRAGRKDGSQ